MASQSDVEARRQATMKAKVVLLGEGAVGKTSIVLRYAENKFNDKHVQTLQVHSLVGYTAEDYVVNKYVYCVDTQAQHWFCT